MKNLKYKPLTQFANLLNGYAFKSKNYVNSGIRVIRIANVQDGYISDEKPCFYPLDTVEDISKYILRENDFLVSLTGNVGRVALLTEDFLPAALNQRVSCIRIKDENLLPKFLFYYFLRKQFQKDCINASQGVAQLNLSTKWLEQYPIPVLSIEEQKRVVARIEELFSELDNGVETLKKTKQQLGVYRQAVLKEAFENCKNLSSIRDMSTLVTSGSRGWAQYYASEGAKFIRIGNLTRDSIDINFGDTQYVKLPDKAEGLRSKLQPNDVLVSITADLGSIGLVPSNIGEAYINQHIAVVRFKNSTQGKFMAWYLRSEWGQKDLLKNKRGAGKLGLGLDDIRNSRVPAVSDSEAGAIVELIESCLSVYDSIERTVVTALQQAEAMRQSILKKAFEGVL